MGHSRCPSKRTTSEPPPSGNGHENGFGLGKVNAQRNSLVVPGAFSLLCEMRYPWRMLRSLTNRLGSALGESRKADLFLRAFAFVKIPMIFWVGARIVEIDDERCVVRIPLKRRTRNHLRSMYFGVLMVGADVAGGLMAFRRAQQSGRRISFAFKSADARFLKRAEHDTFFECRDGAVVAEMFDESARTGARVNRPVHVVATTPAKLGSEPVAEFAMTLSVKVLGERPSP